MAKTLVSAGQLTMIDSNDFLSTGPLPPPNPVKDETSWIDTSVTPNLLKTWNGTVWVIVNEVNVGGRNYLKNSGIPVSNPSYLIKDYILTEQILDNEDVVITIWGSIALGLSSFMICNSGAYVKVGFATLLSTGVYQFKGKWKVGSASNTYLRVYKYPNNTSTDSTINRIKLEKGTQSTDYTPSQEDLDAAILLAQTAADTANTLLTDIASDAKLTPSEKKDVKKEWDQIVGEKSKLEASALEFGVSYTAYANSYNSLNTYLSPLIVNLTTTSDIVGATFRSTFKVYYDAKIDLLNAIASKGKLNDQVVVIDSKTKKFMNVASFSSQLGNLTGYLVITSPILRNKMVQLSLSGFIYVGSSIGNGNFKLDISAYHSNGFSTLNYSQTGNVNIPKVQVAKTVLTNGQLIYILGFADTVWSHPKISIDQVIVGYETPPDSWKDGWSIEVKTDISMYFNVTNVPGTNIIGVLTDMASDGVLDAVEKKRVLQEWESIKSEYSNTLNEGSTKGVSTSSYSGSYNTLNTYLTPLLSNMAINSSITRTVFINNFKAYYEAKSALQKAITEKVTAEFTAVRGEIQDVTTSVGALNTYVDGAFADGVIDTAEAIAIEKYINSVFTEKSDVQSKYDSIYNDTYLVGTPKSNLSSSWMTYSTAHNNLTNSINAAIADKKTTVTEKQDVDVKFTLYRNALSVLTTRFQEAIAAIDKGKIDAIQVGGRNLLKGTKDGSVNIGSGITDGSKYLGFSIIKTTLASTGYTDTFQALSINPLTGTDYVVSFYAKASVATNIQCHFYLPNTTLSSESSSGIKIIGATGYSEVAITTTWQKYWVKWTQGPTADAKRIIIGRNQIVGVTVEIAGVMFTEGSSPLPWSPSPEDIQKDIDDIQIGGRNYVRDSKITPATAQFYAGGTGTFVNDAKFGNVIEYSRPAGGGDFQFSFIPIVDSLFNTELVYFVIAKDMTGSGYFAYGGYIQTFTIVNPIDSNIIDLGDGWKMYWSTFKSGSSLGPNAFGINSIAGTWRFYAVGVQKGNKPSDWSPAPEDLEAEIALAKAQAQNAQTTASATASVTSFLNTDINGNVVSTGSLLVGDVVGANAGITGVTDRGNKSVRFYSGSTHAGRNTANWLMRDDGVEEKWITYNGQRVRIREEGVIDGVWMERSYNVDGTIAKISSLELGYMSESWFKDGNPVYQLGRNGIFYISEIPHSWNARPTKLMTTTASPTDATLISTLKSSLLFSEYKDTEFGNYATIAINQPINWYLFNAGRSATSANYEQYQQFRYAGNNGGSLPSSTNPSKLADGWYVEYISANTDDVPSGIRNAPYSFNANFYKILSGKLELTKTLTISGTFLFSP